MSPQLTAAEVEERVRSVAPKAAELPADGVSRWAVPIGSTGLGHIIVDIVLSEYDPEGRVVLRAFGKEGLFARHPTQRLADQLWAELNR